MCKIIAVANQKSGVGKTTTCVKLGIGLAREGKRMLLVEADAQGSMAVSLGIQELDELDVTLVNIMEKIINDEDVELGEGILHHEEGIDFIPANIELARLETSLVNVMLWSSIFVTFRSKNSLCMSCFKWRLPTIIRMGTDMIIPYAHISPDCFIQTFRTGKTVRID